MSLPSAIDLYFDWTIQKKRAELRRLTQEPPALPADSGRLAMNPMHLPTRGDYGRSESRQDSPEAE